MVVQPSLSLLGWDWEGYNYDNHSKIINQEPECQQLIQRAGWVPL